MKLRGVHHVSINVHNAEESRDFYVDVLGLEVLDTRPEEFTFPGYWLRVGDGEIHLIEEPGFQPPKGQHFALRVDDLDDTLAELRSKGIGLEGDYMGIPAGRPIDVPGVGRQAFIFDPTGNMVELNQPNR